MSILQTVEQLENFIIGHSLSSIRYNNNDYNIITYTLSNEDENNIGKFIVNELTFDKKELAITFNDFISDKNSKLRIELEL